MNTELVKEIDDYLGIELSPNCPMMHPDSPSTQLLRKCKAELSKTLWVPVEERLPETRQIVLIAGGIGHLAHGGTWYTDTGPDAGRQIQWEVTHWMPLPTSPNNEER